VSSCGTSAAAFDCAHVTHWACCKLFAVAQTYAKWLLVETSAAHARLIWCLHVPHFRLQGGALVVRQLVWRAYLLAACAGRWRGLAGAWVSGLAHSILTSALNLLRASSIGERRKPTRE
jgi:hypothetical protein